jgi:hypothetical protein
MTIDLTITRENELGEEIEIDVECEFSYHKAYRGARDTLCGVRGGGPPLEPDEPAHFEFEGAVRCDTGEEIELTASEIEEAEQKAWDYDDSPY